MFLGMLSSEMLLWGEGVVMGVVICLGILPRDILHCCDTLFSEKLH